MSGEEIDADIEAQAEKLNGDARAMNEIADSLDGAEDCSDEPEGMPKRVTVSVPQLEGETEGKAMARAVLRPTTQGAVTVRSYCDSAYSELDLNELIKALSEQTKAVISRDVGRAEAMLAVQAHTLDAIFNNLARRAMGAELLRISSRAYLKLGLRAQAQCRSTWEAISEIQNPRVAGFVQQANISHGPQQVNNASRTGETGKSAKQTIGGNRSMSQTNGWTAERRKRQARADPEVEAVGGSRRGRGLGKGKG